MTEPKRPPRPEVRLESVLGHTPRAHRMAGLHRLLHGRGRRSQMIAQPVALCECDRPAPGPDGMCVRCRRPPFVSAGRGPARSW